MSGPVQDGDILQRIVSLKEQGNEAFKAQNLDEAAKSYTEAIELCSQCKDSGSAKLLSQLHSNRAAVRLQGGEFREALNDANTSIQLDESNMKGYYRAAKSSMNLELYKESCEICEAGLRKEPNHRELLDIFSVCAERAGLVTGSSRGFSEEDVTNCHERLQELEAQYQSLVQRIRGRELEMSRTNRTTEILADMGDITCYKAVGRGFLKDEKENLIDEMAVKSKTAESELCELRENMKRLIQRKEAAAKEMQEITAYFNRLQQRNN